jgi:predicted amidophosphoribosyltransferase
MDDATRECPRCQADVFKGAHFCVRCGCRLEGHKPTPAKLLAVRPSSVYSETPANGLAKLPTRRVTTPALPRKR